MLSTRHRLLFFLMNLVALNDLLQIEVLGHHEASASLNQLKLKQGDKL